MCYLQSNLNISSGYRKKPFSLFNKVNTWDQYFFCLHRGSQFYNFTFSPAFVIKVGSSASLLDNFKTCQPNTTKCNKGRALEKINILEILCKYPSGKKKKTAEVLPAGKDCLSNLVTPWSTGNSHQAELSSLPQPQDRITATPSQSQDSVSKHTQPKSIQFHAET